MQNWFKFLFKQGLMSMTHIQREMVFLHSCSLPSADMKKSFACC